MKRTIRIEVGIILVCAFMEKMQSANLFLDLTGPEISPENMRVEVGDTVTWTAKGKSGVHQVASYTAEWRTLIKAGETFSFTFSQPGFYAYRSEFYLNENPDSWLRSAPGTIQVLDPGPSPKVISIAAPLDGFHFPPGVIEIVARIGMATSNVKEIEFIDGTNSLGKVSSPPYRVDYRQDLPGGYGNFKRLSIRAVAKFASGESVASDPVTITVDRERRISLPVRLASGEILVFFSHVAGQECVKSAETADFVKWSLPQQTFQDVGQHTYVDRSAKAPAIKARFYRVTHCP